MKIFEKEEAKKTIKDDVKFDEEESLGISFNWIVANYYSLERFIKNNKLSEKDLWARKVLCKSIVLDQSKQVTQSNNKFERINTSSLSIIRNKTTVHFDFFNQRNCSVPLSVLSMFAFSMRKEIILGSRIYDDYEKDKSSNSIKKSMITNGSPFIEDDIQSKIKKCLSCKSKVFLFPKAYEDGSEVEWYIPLDEDEEVNKSNAMSQFIASNGVSEIKSGGVYTDEHINSIIEARIKKEKKAKARKEKREKENILSEEDKK